MGLLGGLVQDLTSSSGRNNNQNANPPFDNSNNDRELRSSNDSLYSTQQGEREEYYHPAMLDRQQNGQQLGRVSRPMNVNNQCVTGQNPAPPSYGLSQAYEGQQRYEGQVPSSSYEHLPQRHQQQQQQQQRYPDSRQQQYQTRGMQQQYYSDDEGDDYYDDPPRQQTRPSGVVGTPRLLGGGGMLGGGRLLGGRRSEDDQRDNRDYSDQRSGGGRRSRRQERRADRRGTSLIGSIRSARKGLMQSALDGHPKK